MNRDYDYDKVIDLVKSATTKNIINNAETQLNNISKTLSKTQDDFHAKNMKDNIVEKIYDGFSTAIGYYNSSSNKGNGTAYLIRSAVEILEIAYQDALSIKDSMKVDASTLAKDNTLDVNDSKYEVQLAELDKNKKSVSDQKGGASSDNIPGTENANKQETDNTEKTDNQNENSQENQSNNPATPERPEEPKQTGDNNLGYNPGNGKIPAVDENGLIVKQQSDAGQAVINKLYSDIDSTKPPGVTVRAQGTHSAELDSMIDNLSAEECAWVLSRIENEGFGQSGAGYSTASAESHKAFIEQQLIERFDGDIHNLLKNWGTYEYGGY